MRHIAIFILTISLTSAVFGQQNKLEIGLEYNPSVTFLYGNESVENNLFPIICFSTGMSLQYKFYKFLFLKTEILYEQKGASSDKIFSHTTPSPYILYCKEKFDYIIVPIQIGINHGQKINYFASAGLFLGYLIKETQHNNGGVLGPHEYDNTENFKRFDTGLTFGLGISIPVKNKYSLSFELRNNFGLHNVSKLPVINDGTIKTNSTNFLICFTYKLTRQKNEEK